ncbi:MAG: 4Fe-4S binding protein, partial [Ferruginibacter sp.]
MKKKYPDLSVTASNATLPLKQKLGIFLGMFGLFIMVLALCNVQLPFRKIWLPVSILSIFSGVVLFANNLYLTKPAGIQLNGIWFKSISSRGLLAWAAGIIITLLYIVLYWFPQYLGYDEKGNNTGLVSLFDPLSKILNGKPASQWFVYGTLYTMAILGMGYKFILKYRHNKYQVVRTISVMFFQLGFAFLIPEILSKLNPDAPYYSKDLKNMWPLNYSFFHDWNLKAMIDDGYLGLFVLLFGLAMIFIISPVLTYFYGKRWYCSWVCGCGGLAETAGDSFRHLSDKSTKAWKFERWSIHTVLV